MAAQFHVWKSKDDVPEEGGSYEHAKTFVIKSNMLDLVSRLLNEGWAVMIVPEEVAD